MKKIISAKEAASFVKDNSTLMVGGFLDCGAPDKLVDALVETDVKNLTLICNDTTYPNVDKGKLVEGDKVKKVIASHIGTNPITGKRMMNKEIEVEILPMGTFVEKIRAFGAGLGGILEIKGKKFIFEEPLGADVAFIYGTKVDKFGNVSYFGTTRNFNTTMAMAADTVIVQADEIVDCLDPNEVVIPGIFIDYIVKNGEE